MKEWILLSIKDVVKKLVKKVFQSPLISVLIPFQNGDNKTTLKNLEKQFISVIKIKTNLFTTHIERREGVTDRNGGFY